MRSKGMLIGVVIGVLLSATAIVLAGDLDPSNRPSEAGSQMYTLEQIYHRLDSGAATPKMTGFTEPVSGPTGGTMHTLDEVMAKAPAPDDKGAIALNVVTGRTFWGLTLGQWGLQTGSAAVGSNVVGGNGQLIFTIPDGFYSASKTCTASDSGLVAGNIKSGTSIFGVSGSYLGQEGLTNCSGVCTNTQTDNNNCGSCGNACGTGKGCHAGTCS
jgi:hypothetical protein